MSGVAETAIEILPRRRARMSLLGWIAATVVVLCLALAVCGPWIAPYPAGTIVSQTVFGPMTWAHPLGIDYLGRDMLSRVLSGARYTIGVALPATLIASGSGTLLGMLAASWGGAADQVISRAMDTLISFPSLIFSLVVVAALGSPAIVLILTAAVIYTPGCFRIVRSVAVGINETDFVAAARARGERNLVVVLEEILPNMVAPILTDFGLRFVFIVLLLSSLSFLGLGIQPPYSDWGGLVRENIDGLSQGAPAVIVPAIAIAILTVSTNLLIDSLPGRKVANYGG
ncbi:MAG TPA: ABC transporter permease [Acetobacteraceae bacterium]